MDKYINFFSPILVSLKGNWLCKAKNNKCPFSIGFITCKSKWVTTIAQRLGCGKEAYHGKGLIHKNIVFSESRL